MAPRVEALYDFAVEHDLLTGDKNGEMFTTERGSLLASILTWETDDFDSDDDKCGYLKDLGLITFGEDFDRLTEAGDEVLRYLSGVRDEAEAAR
jgi:hypothetical protein